MVNSTASLGNQGRIKYSNKYKSLALAAVFCGIYFVLLVAIWGLLALYNPIVDWLINSFAATNWISPLIYIHDLLINILLGFPLAIFIYRLRPQKYFYI